MKDGFNKYLGVQGVLAIISALTVSALLLLGMEIPSEVYAVYGLIVGFYFAKNGKTVVQETVLHHPTNNKKG